MNIKPPSVNAANLASTYQVATQSKPAQANDQEVKKSASVAISAGTQALYDEQNDVNLAKVNALRRALADGTLKIRPERLAELLLGSAKELLSEDLNQLK